MSTTQILELLNRDNVMLPVRIRIPSLSIDSAFVHVELTESGEMDIPKSPTEVAWFELGPRPGAPGNAVVAGHYGWKNGIPAVFDHLDKLQKGDKLYVDDENGLTMTFVVRATQSFGENDDATAVFVAHDGLAHLNLVTCQGVWNKQNKSYSKRLVVFTDRVIE